MPSRDYPGGFNQISANFSYHGTFAGSGIDAVAQGSISRRYLDTDFPDRPCGIDQAEMLARLDDEGGRNFYLLRGTDACCCPCSYQVILSSSGLSIRTDKGPSAEMVFALSDQFCRRGWDRTGPAPELDADGNPIPDPAEVSVEVVSPGRAPRPLLSDPGAFGEQIVSVPGPGHWFREGALLRWQHPDGRVFTGGLSGGRGASGTLTAPTGMLQISDASTRHRYGIRVGFLLGETVNLAAAKPAGSEDYPLAVLTLLPGGPRLAAGQSVRVVLGDSIAGDFEVVRAGDSVVVIAAALRAPLQPPAFVGTIEILPAPRAVRPITVVQDQISRVPGVEGGATGFISLFVWTYDTTPAHYGEVFGIDSVAKALSAPSQGCGAGISFSGSADGEVGTAHFSISAQ